MVELCWTLSAVLLGCAVVYRFGNISGMQPRWAAFLFLFGSGAAVGIGLTSCSFFLSSLVAPGIPSAPIWLEFGALAWILFSILRGSRGSAEAGASTDLNVLLVGMFVLALALVTAAMARAWQVKPEGDWDAWFIWNLRARFLAAGGEFAQRAWSPMLALAHPEYPLLTSGFVARCWSYSHSFSNVAPIATSYLFFLSLISMATGGIAITRDSGSLGLLYGLALLGSPRLLHEVPSQYADIPVATYFLGAILLTMLDRPVLAGLFAGFAAWTKDEGLLFLAALLGSAIVCKRDQVARLVLGALPIGALVLIFKAVNGSAYASGRSSSQIVQKLTDQTRYWHIIATFSDQFTRMAALVWWWHPILPALVLAVALRFERRQYRNMAFSAMITLSLLAGYSAVYVITPYDLSWQLRYSSYRLFAQVWPILLLACFIGLRRPEALQK